MNVKYRAEKKEACTKTECRPLPDDKINPKQDDFIISGEILQINFKGDAKTWNKKN